MHTEGVLVHLLFEELSHLLFSVPGECDSFGVGDAGFHHLRYDVVSVFGLVDIDGLCLASPF